MPTTTASVKDTMETNETPRGSLEGLDTNSKDPPVSVTDDDIDTAPEVKVYSNEDDQEEELQESKHGAFEPGLRRDKIEDDKSGLINESEQSKDARHGDQLAFARTLFHDQAASSASLANIQLYLQQIQSLQYNATYHLMGRPSPFYDALSPASAAAATTHPGLRHPLNYLPPPPHGQRPRWRQGLRLDGIRGALLPEGLWA